MQTEKMTLQLVLIVSIIATLGSLYFSEVKQFIPCEMCWYTRIVMYPIVLISLIGIFVKDKWVTTYTLVFSLIGIMVSSYHYALQKLPALSGVTQCEGVSCSAQYINWLGFITIPFLALVAFVLIFILSIINIKNVRRIKHEQ